MQKYTKYSTNIYHYYMKYGSKTPPEIHFMRARNMSDWVSAASPQPGIFVE